LEYYDKNEAVSRNVKCEILLSWQVVEDFIALLYIGMETRSE
jgi:hypothetical protein